jgi:hypothetical protein
MKPKHKSEWPKDLIFVFGSNRAGYHGAGAAKEAFEKHGAKWWQGEGLAGNSYALPTKDVGIRTLPLTQIREHVKLFITVAHACPQFRFFVTAVGTGLAGYSHEDIAPLFKKVPQNCFLPDAWKTLLLEDDDYKSGKCYSYHSDLKQ